MVYGGTTDVAGNIRYDNTGTGLGSVTVQNAITELKGLADGATTQVAALPVASAANVNKIYQYTGATNANYINGMFYKCVYDTNVNPAVYKWQIIDTSTSSADEVTYDNTNSGLAAANVQAAIDELNTNDVGKKEYVNNELRGEIFNSYNQHDIGVVTVSKNQASGADSHAEGGSTIASGTFSHAEGYGNTASGIYSHVEGSANTSNGHSSHTEGHDNKAKGNYSHAEGLSTTATGINAHAEGYRTVATTDDTHAEGRETQAIALSAHAEGFKTFASGQYSHAEGYNTTASGQFSHAGGRNTIANTAASTTIGKYNIADGTGENDPKHLFIIGNGTGLNTRSNILEVSDTYLNVNGDIK